MDIFNSELLYRIICILSALAFFGMGGSLIRIKGVMEKLRSTFPEELIPYHYLSARRALGFACIFIGLITLMRIWLAIDGFVIGSFQIIIATSALLSIYASPVVNRMTVLVNVLIFVVMSLIYVIFWNHPVVKGTVRYVWLVLFLIQIFSYTVIFFMESRRYNMTMTDRMGADEAQYYSKKEIVAFFILALMIAICSCTSLYIHALGFVTFFIAAYTIFYMFLVLYFHNQWEDSSVVHEIVSEVNTEN